MIREEPAFKIKNANLPVFVLHVNTTDPDTLKSELEKRLTQAPGFFSNAPMVIGLAAIADSDAMPDLVDLAALIASHGIRVAGVIGGSAAQRDAAVQAGFALFPDVTARQTAASTEPVVEAAVPSQPELSGLEAEAVQAVADSPAPAEDSDVAPVPIARPTMVIDKPVRTGQRVYAEGADLVVLASVNAGAEVIADGNIHIYAPLRGKAIAGAHGNESARIFAQRLEAELISIAGCFQVFAEGIPENVRDKPVQVSLDGSRLVFQPLAG